MCVCGVGKYSVVQLSAQPQAITLALNHHLLLKSVIVYPAFYKLRTQKLLTNTHTHTRNAHTHTHTHSVTGIYHFVTIFLLCYFSCVHALLYSVLLLIFNCVPFEVCWISITLPNPLLDHFSAPHPLHSDILLISRAFVLLPFNIFLA